MASPLDWLQQMWRGASGPQYGTLVPGGALAPPAPPKRPGVLDRLGAMLSTPAKHRHRAVDHGPLFAPPYDAEADAIGSYNDAVRVVGEQVKAGAPVPDFFRSIGAAADG